MRVNYSEAICAGFDYLLSQHEEVFTIGQGLWAPWYVGSSMKDLDKKFGKARVIDSPVSELAVTGAAVGASLLGYRPIVIHPRMDFMLLAVDQIVTQAANWSSMFGATQSPAVTFRGIVNRGGEQGAQHSQCLHAWFSHVPGLRVVLPATAKDARDLLIASVLSDEPVLYVDDRWLYDLEDDLGEAKDISLNDVRPTKRTEGDDITLVGSGYTTRLLIDAAWELEKEGIRAEVIDLRTINPLYYDEICSSVTKTGRLLVADSGFSPCGLAGEIIAGVSERIELEKLLANPIRLTLPQAPAPTSKALESAYYLSSEDVVKRVRCLFSEKSKTKKVVNI